MSFVQALSLRSGGRLTCTGSWFGFRNPQKHSQVGSQRLDMGFECRPLHGRYKGCWMKLYSWLLLLIVLSHHTYGLNWTCLSNKICYEVCVYSFILNYQSASPNASSPKDALKSSPVITLFKYNALQIEIATQSLLDDHAWHIVTASCQLAHANPFFNPSNCNIWKQFNWKLTPNFNPLFNLIVVLFPIPFYD